MFFILQPAVTMTSLPVVNEDFCVLCFITQRLCESTVIFVCVREYDATEVRYEKTGFAQPCAQCFDGFFGLRTSVDNRQRIFGNQVDVDRPDVERRWQ